MIETTRHPGAVRRAAIVATLRNLIRGGLLLALTIEVVMEPPWPTDESYRSALVEAMAVSRGREDAIIRATILLERRLLGDLPPASRVPGSEQDAVLLDGERVSAATVRRALAQFDVHDVLDARKCASLVGASFIRDYFRVSDAAANLGRLLAYAFLPPDETAPIAGAAWIALTDADSRVRRLARLCVAIHAVSADVAGRRMAREITTSSSTPDARAGDEWWINVERARIASDDLGLRPDELSPLISFALNGGSLRSFRVPVKGRIPLMSLSLAEGVRPRDSDWLVRDSGYVIANIAARIMGESALGEAAKTYRLSDELVSLIRARWIDGPLVRIDGRSFSRLEHLVFAGDLVRWLVECVRNRRPVEVAWAEVLDRGRPGFLQDVWRLWACAALGQSTCGDLADEFEKCPIVGFGAIPVAQVFEDLRERAPGVPRDAFRVIEAVGSTSEYADDRDACFELRASVRIIAAARGERAVRRVPWRRVIDAMEQNSRWLLALPSLARVANTPRSEMAEFLRQARAIVRPWDVRTRLELALRELSDD